MNQEAAESLAIGALSFLAADPDRLGRFLSLSGLTPETLRAAAAEPGFLGAVLDHLCSDESLLLAFSANGDHDAEAVMEAHARLAPPPQES
ncbi:DUF3572 domain-containing protein [Beijerinckia mobilis]|uniref:DUF3572 domain-containing protein n=1 Tax=Beijerinckia mobilis TaxID=231434 RepID=UPI00054F3B4E|nr:DUF3572 domain-containing protein [Beijerinckia mobilis]